jgi:hypothetical protein
MLLDAASVVCATLAASPLVLLALLFMTAAVNSNWVDAEITVSITSAISPLKRSASSRAQALRLGIFRSELGRMDHVLFEELDRLRHRPDFILPIDCLDLRRNVALGEPRHRAGKRVHRLGDAPGHRQHGAHADEQGDEQ